ncbi:MAG: hypothetical protein ABS87_04850 [Sphingomonas sp. SCN 67-18]|uniref:hypothetical protein n=1 Tax=uncultured Sphingomonas sp. TaxID=158754 RepID=UPI00086936AA|nr:hypothetical protein [Sphingomonas sp. SCN 67-18]ODU21696.1 MAG: hypothetical protein ABS87_04850 [Sphingomonas sp. SCN 67-18]
MRLIDRWRRFRDGEAARLTLMAIGWLLIAGAPVVGVLPGPGGLVLFAGGLALLLRNSLWVKRHYVRFKRRWPRYGAWADRGLRRSSARRRAKIAREEEAAGD